MITGDISDTAMREAFNLGVGLIAIVNKNDVSDVLKISEESGTKGFVIGEVE